MIAPSSSPQSEQAPDWLPEPGSIVADKYEVERVLGHGGMGVVVAAVHRQLGNRVAIKYLRPDLVEQPDALARFLREARAAVALRGEHVARVQDVGTLRSGAPYMVMEFLTGIDLDALLEEGGPLGVEDAVEFVLQACEALAEAHALGIVHRDLKPGNLCLTERPDGSPLVKVLDFGIAKALAPEPAEPTNLTATGTALGTPMFMSPEQIRDAKGVDARTDVWALGAVLYQLLTGEPPFVADNLPGLCAKIMTDEPPPLDQRRPDVPAELARVVARSLAKPLEDRYQDVAELAQALEPFGPPRAAVHVERTMRILAGRSSVNGLRSPSASGRWRAQDSVAHTVASTNGSTGEVGARATSAAAAPQLVTPGHAAGRRPGTTVASGEERKQTAATWHTDRGPAEPSRAQQTVRRRSIGVGATIVAVLLLAGGSVLWLASGPGGEDRGPAEPTPPATPAAAATHPSSTPGGPRTAAQGGSEALTSTDGGGPAQATATPPTAPSASAAPASSPVGTPPPVASAPPVRPPATARPQPRSNDHGSALSDRK